MNGSDRGAGSDRVRDLLVARAIAAKARQPRETKRKGKVIPFLLVSAAPVAGVVWWLTRSPEDRDRVLSKIPTGVGARAVTAAIALGALIVLARVVLPGARGAGAALARARAWIRSRGRGARIALAPLALVVELLWLVTQIVFAVDAIAIVACGVAFLVCVARIVKPDLFPGLPG